MADSAVLDVLSSHEAFEALMENNCNNTESSGPADYKKLYEQEIDKKSTLTKLAQKGK